MGKSRGQEAAVHGRLGFCLKSKFPMEHEAMAMLQKYAARAHPSASLPGSGSHVQSLAVTFRTELSARTRPYSEEFPEVPVCGASQIRALRQQEAVVLIDVRSDEEVAVSRLSDSPHDRASHICYEPVANAAPHPVQWVWMRMRRVWMRMRLYRAHLP